MNGTVKKRRLNNVKIDSANSRRLKLVRNNDDSVKTGNGPKWKIGNK